MGSNTRLQLRDGDDVRDDIRSLSAASETAVDACLLEVPRDDRVSRYNGFAIAPPTEEPARRPALNEKDDAPEGASIFAIGRRGELKWCTPSAQRDLKQIGARHPHRSGRLTPEWAHLLWKPIHPHRLEYQIAPLDADSLPCRGRVAWSPRRPLELTVSIWRLRTPSGEPDPTWRRLMRELRGDEVGGDDGRPAA